jgi:nitrate/TMAO reductase-like tetraheme cytochrome c subunit
MKYSDKIIVTIFLILGGSVLLAATPEKGEQIPMAKFCAGCHKPEPGVMMGFLDNISIKAKTIQMSFIVTVHTPR